MGNIQYKLDGVRYFLRLMEREAASDDFRHAFDGFLADFRSVHAYIVRATQNNKALKDWYRSERQLRGFPSKKSGREWSGPDPVLTLLHREGDISVHMKPSEFRVAANVHLGTIRLSVTLLPVRAVGSDESAAAVPLEPPVQIPPPSPQPSPPQVERRWYFNDLPDEEVIPACRVALQKLETLVTACEAMGIQ